MSPNQQLALHADEREGRQRRDEIESWAREILGAVAAPVVVVDADLRVRTANQAFFQTFRVSPEEIAGHQFWQPREGTWDLLKLRTFLERLLAGNAGSSDFEVEQDFPRIGRRAMRFKVRSMPTAGAPASMLLVCVEDITEGRRMQEQIRKYRQQLQRLITKWAVDRRS